MIKEFTGRFLERPAGLLRKLRAGCAVSWPVSEMTKGEIC